MFTEIFEDLCIIIIAILVTPVYAFMDFVLLLQAIELKDFEFIKTFNKLVGKWYKYAAKEICNCKNADVEFWDYLDYVREKYI